MGATSDPGAGGPQQRPTPGAGHVVNPDDASLSDHERAILAVEQEFSRMVTGARKAMRNRAAAMDPSLLPFDYKVIGTIWHHGPMVPERLGLTASELTCLLETDKSMISRSVKRLEETGFVTREQDPQDARAQLIRLTRQASERYAESGMNDRMAVQERLLDWSTEQVQALAQLLNKLNGPSPEGGGVSLPVVTDGAPPGGRDAA